MKEEDKDVVRLLYLRANGVTVSAYIVRDPSTYKYSTPQWHMLYDKIIICCTHAEALAITKLFTDIPKDDQDVSSSLDGVVITRYHFLPSMVDGVQPPHTPHYHIRNGDRIIGYTGEGGLGLFTAMVKQFEERQTNG